MAISANYLVHEAEPYNRAQYLSLKSSVLHSHTLLERAAALKINANY